MTLNGVMAVILRYFSEFGYLPGVLRKSSRSLSHLLMSSRKQRPPAILVFKTKSYLPIVVKGALCAIMPNFVANDHTVTRYHDFSTLRMVAVCHFDS